MKKYGDYKMTKYVWMGMLTVLGVFAIVVIIAFCMAIITKWLWNSCLVGSVVGVNEITFWKAFGLNVLTGIFFRTSTSYNKK